MIGRLAGGASPTSAQNKLSKIISSITDLIADESVEGKQF
jgi:hypothetical protein